VKNSNCPIGNRTHDLPACSAVPQPTAPPCAPNNISNVASQLVECTNTGVLLQLHCVSGISVAATVFPLSIVDLAMLLSTTET
jgi:hypothetical protein